MAPEEFEWNFRCNFPIDFSDWWLRHFLWSCPNMNVTGLHWWSVNIGSGNGLVLSGNKPLPEPMLTQISVVIWCHWARIEWVHSSSQINSLVQHYSVNAPEIPQSCIQPSKWYFHKKKKNETHSPTPTAISFDLLMPLLVSPAGNMCSFIFDISSRHLPARKKFHKWFAALSCRGDIELQRGCTVLKSFTLDTIWVDILVGYHKDMPWEIAPATILSCQLGKDHRPDICKDDDAEYSFHNRNNTCCILWSGDGINGIFAGVGPVAMMMIRHRDSL